MQDKSKNINLRFLGYSKDNKFYLISLETGILVCGDNIRESLDKMKDAMVSYFKSFSKEELLNNEYIRKAPLKYHLLFFTAVLKSSIRSFRTAILSYNAEFDTKDNHLRFA